MVTVLGANTLSSESYDVANSLRFGSNTYLSATFGSAPTLATKNTYSTWFKRSTLNTLQQLMATSSNAVSIVINTNNTIAFYTNSGQLLSPKVYRDNSAWMHFVYTFDSTQGTAANRTKVYINGVQETSFNNTAYPAQEASQLGVNGQVMEIGTRSNHDRIFEGYMAETAFVDGQALAADSFGEFDDSGNWRAIDISDLTFGNNGFYLEYKAAGTGTNSSGMGADTSGNDFHFAPTNLVAIDQTTDTCTNNFATLNPLYQQGNNTFSEGNCKVVLEAGDGTKGVASNIAVSSGKWYFEVKQGAATNSVIQVREASDKEDDLSYYEGSYAGYQFNNGNQYITGNSSSAYGASYADGDIIMVALDMDNNRVYFGKNGSWNDGDGNADEANLNDYAPVNGVTNAIAAFGNANGSATATAEFNFGNPPYANSSSVSDGNGFGNFEFAVPSGYFAICTKNLAEYG